MIKVYALLLCLGTIPYGAAQYPSRTFSATLTPFAWPAADAENFTTARGVTNRPSGEEVSIARLRHRIPDKARAAFLRGLKSAQNNAWQIAATEFNQAVAVDPDFSEAHGNLGITYTHLELLDQAVSEFWRVLALDPATAIHHANLSYVLIRLHRGQEAEREAQTAVDLDPTNFQAHYLLGFLLASRPETRDLAAKHLLYAARSVPEAHLVLAELYRAQGVDHAADAELNTYHNLINPPDRSRCCT